MKTSCCFFSEFCSNLLQQQERPQHSTAKQSRCCFVATDPVVLSLGLHRNFPEIPLQSPLIFQPSFAPPLLSPLPDLLLPSPLRLLVSSPPFPISSRPKTLTSNPSSPPPHPHRPDVAGRWWRRPDPAAAATGCCLPPPPLAAAAAIAGPEGDRAPPPQGNRRDPAGSAEGADPGNAAARKTAWNVPAPPSPRRRLRGGVGSPAAASWGRARSWPALAESAAARGSWPKSASSDSLKSLSDGSAPSASVLNLAINSLNSDAVASRESSLALVYPVFDESIDAIRRI